MLVVVQCVCSAVESGASVDCTTKLSFIKRYPDAIIPWDVIVRFSHGVGGKVEISLRYAGGVQTDFRCVRAVTICQIPCCLPRELFRNLEGLLHFALVVLATLVDELRVTTWRARTVVAVRITFDITSQPRNDLVGKPPAALLVSHFPRHDEFRHKRSAKPPVDIKLQFNRSFAAELLGFNEFGRFHTEAIAERPLQGICNFIYGSLRRHR